ncbi:MAG: exopolysaccharide biosynthesis polyprenyl glycosylphosphotransferase [Acholeplasmataceae bacterium]|nr:exopolysaccharide biosynthesis polyprenyl glycosylphosphotransferase [Acholeplasmataceae bacterium]
MKSVSLIGVDEEIIHLAAVFIKSKYHLKYIMIKQVDYERLNCIEAVFLDYRLENKEKERLYRYCLDHGIRVHLLPGVMDLSKVKQHQLRDRLVFELSNYCLTSFQKFTKRLFDIIMSLLIIIILSPLMLFIWLLMRIIDKGPALYYQKRLTYQGRVFILYKFRTMVRNAESKSGAVLSAINDERVTRIGKVLRKTRLDETPQIFNVLIGDMSLVGPRPERAYFVQKFMEENEFYRYRFNVKAGVTGLAQVNCYYHSSYCDKLKYDLLYIANYSIFNDIKLLFKTVKILFSKVSANGTATESLENLLRKKNLVLKEEKPGILELRTIDEKDNDQL